MSWTTANLVSAVQNIAQSSDSTSATAFLNDAYLDVIGRIGSNATSATKTLTSGTNDYALGSSPFSLNVLKILEVRYLALGESQSYRLAPSDLQTVLDLNSNLATGFLKMYAVYGAERIIFYPTPSQADSVTLYYSPKPTTLSGSGVPTDIDEAWQYRLLVPYAVAMLCQLDEEQAGLSQQKMQEYEANLRAYQSWRTRMVSPTSKGMIVGYPDRTRRLPHDPSSDYR